MRSPTNRNIFLDLSYERWRQANEIMFVNHESPRVSNDLYVEISSKILVFGYLKYFLNNPLNPSIPY